MLNYLKDRVKEETVSVQLSEGEVMLGFSIPKDKKELTKQDYQDYVDSITYYINEEAMKND